jgi:uncharacterized glyoxalase superfamily protein PhnB
MPTAEVIPVIEYPDVRDAVKFLCRTFNFLERIRIADHRSQLDVGFGGAIIVAQGRPDAVPTGSSLMIRVNGIDAHYQRTIYNGTEPLNPPKTFPYGERQYNVKDPWGHHWTFTQTVEDVEPHSWGGTVIEEPFWK